MWIRMMLWPWWARSLMYAGLTAVGLTCWAVTELMQDSSIGYRPWIFAVAVPGCLLLGALLGVGSEHAHDSYCAALIPAATPADRSLAITAVWRGPVPAESHVRDAAARVADVYLTVYRKQRGLQITSYTLFGMYQIAQLSAIHHARQAATPAFVACVLFAAAAWAVYTPKRVARRADIMAPGLAATAPQS